MANTVVRARIDEHVKEEAAAVMASIGLTVSDAFRLMMVRIAKDKALPFEPLIPNAETVEAMKELGAAGCRATSPWMPCSRGSMREIEPTTRFRRDYKREGSGQLGAPRIDKILAICFA